MNVYVTKEVIAIIAIPACFSSGKGKAMCLGGPQGNKLITAIEESGWSCYMLASPLVEFQFPLDTWKIINFTSSQGCAYDNVMFELMHNYVL